MAISSTERQALLQKKAESYIAGMENSSGVDFSRISADRLLILEALDNWSGRLLAEGGDIKLTHGVDDPACASRFEVGELVRRMHAPPVILYPVSGFSLSDDGELRFGNESSSFRLLPHTSGSRADAICIAQSSHVRNVDAAVNLWALCATEDCLSYLLYQMDEHGLSFGEEEVVAARRIITSALLTNFSIGQVWNAIWRSVKDAAALSTRQYFNIAKASRTIPKKIDKVLTQNAGARGGFPAYDRLASFPMGAVLSLLLNRFGIEDDTPGPEVRARFAADAALAPPMIDAEDEVDEGRALVSGTMFFINEVTALDRMVLACFRDLRIDFAEPEWDENHVVGRLFFSLRDIYAFDGPTFLRRFLTHKGIPEPTPEDVSRHAELAREHKERTGDWVDLSGRSGAMEESLLKAGVDPGMVRQISFAESYPTDPSDVVKLLHSLHDDFGLHAMRADHVQVFDDYFERSDGLFSASFSFKFPEERLEPEGADSDLLLAIAGRNIDRLADLVTASVLNSVNCISEDLRGELFRRVGQRLMDRNTIPYDGWEARP